MLDGNKQNFPNKKRPTIFVIVAVILIILCGTSVYISGLGGFNIDYYDNCLDAYLDTITLADENRYGISKETLLLKEMVKIDENNTFCIMSVGDNYIFMANMKTKDGKYWTNGDTWMVDFEYFAEVGRSDLTIEQWDSKGKFAESIKALVVYKNSNTPEPDGLISSVSLNDEIIMHIFR